MTRTNFAAALVAAIAALAAFAAPAHAIEGAWRVGPGYSVTAEDLASAEGRARFLNAVDAAATRLCREEPTQISRARCAERSVDQAIAGLSEGARTQVRLAQAERDAVQLAATR